MATTLEMLLAALTNGGLPPVPDPAKPMPLGVAAPPNLGMPVAPAQDVPEAPLDTSIINRYLSAAGPAPTAPVQRQPGTLEKIAAVLSGIGEGPAYGMALREQRERPQREYEARLRDYNDRQSNLRLRGIDAAERDQDRRTAQAQRIEDQRYAREFERETRRLNLADNEQRERLRRSYQLERDARADRRALEQELQREQRAKEADAKVRTGRFFTQTKNMALSTELGRHYAGLSDKPLSPAAARLDAKLNGAGEARMGKALGGGGTGGGSSSAVENLLAEFNTLKQMAIQGVKSAGGTPQDEIEAVRRATAGVVRKMARQPRLFEVGTGQFGFPYAKPRGGASAPAQSGGNNDPLGIR